jgi:hypothetical protein
MQGRTLEAEIDFELDEHGRVWLIADGDCRIIGRAPAVLRGMRRLLEVPGT